MWFIYCLIRSSRFLLVACLALNVFGQVRSNLLEVQSVVTESTHHQVLEKWQKLDKLMRNGVEEAMKVVLPMVIRASSEVDISPACSSTIFKMMLAVRQMKGWAISMLDASGKIPTGIFSGTSAQLGAYDQCLNITGPDDFGEGALVGQYCTVEMRLPVPKRERFNRMNLIIKPLDNITTDNYVLQESIKIAQFAYFLAWRTGICVPSTCSKDDMSNIVSHLASTFGTYASVARCEIREPLTFNADQIGVIALFSFFGVMCLAGTLADTLPDILRKYRGEKEPKEESQSLLNRILLTFSVPRNATRLLNTDNVVEDNIPSLHGIRFLSMTWVILGHTYLFVNLQILHNFAIIRTWVRDYAYQTVINGLVAVDSFFFVSGFLVSYLTVKYYDASNGKGINLLIMLLRRVLRLLPSTMIVIASTQLIPILGSGPVWHEITDFLSEKCRKNWWTNFLFFNNFLHAGDMCLPHTWYSAVDMQLFLVAIIFFYLLFKNQAMGIGFNTFMILASILITGAVNFFKDLPPTMLIANPDPLDMSELWGLTHFAPNGHMAPYGIGLALGVILARNKVMRLSPIRQAIGWALAFTGNYAVLFSTYEWNRDTTPSVLVSTIYSAVHRAIWAFGLAWVTYCCATGYGGPVNKILSWNGWIPLSRLTFLAYLWHFLVIYIHQGVLRNNYEASHMLIVWSYFGHLVATFGMAFISYHLFDAPFSQLERLLFSGGAKKPREVVGKNNNVEETNVDAKKVRDSRNSSDYYSNRLPTNGGRELSSLENGNNYPLHRDGRRTQLPDGEVNGTFVYKM